MNGDTILKRKQLTQLPVKPHCVWACPQPYGAAAAQVCVGHTS